MNEYILRPLATSQLLREATPEAAFRMMTEGIVYTQLVQVCTTLDQAVFALINGSVVFDFPGKGKWCPICRHRGEAVGERPGQRALVEGGQGLLCGVPADQHLPGPPPAPGPRLKIARFLRAGRV